ncbi:MAG: hypothetical protein R6X19_03700 [Kiritimatiellia bacterium]
MSDKKENLSDLTPQDAAESTISETDIVFDCPYCGKNLCIDYHGAGLMVACPECEKRLQVPIPEGMDITDFDSSPEEVRVRLIHMREALIEAQSHLTEQQQELASLRERCLAFEQIFANVRETFRTIHEDSSRMRRDLTLLTGSLDRINKSAEDAIGESL